jgi:hypothetical protein
MEIKRDELFHFIRWINFLVGLFNLYYFSTGGGYHLFGIGVLNVAVWVLTRKTKRNND